LPVLLKIELEHAVQMVYCFQEAVNEMKHWLENTGSPSSRIDRITFSKPVPIEQAATEFVIRR
jgi:hypothetical protein